MAIVDNIDVWNFNLRVLMVNPFICLVGIFNDSNLVWFKRLLFILAMEELLEFIQRENDLLDQQIQERKRRWNGFWQSFSSYVSVVKIDNRPLPSPVVTTFLCARCKIILLVSL